MSKLNTVGRIVKLTALGTEFVLLVVGGTLFGSWLDDKTGWKIPVFVLVGAATGTLAGLRLALVGLRESLD